MVDPLTFSILAHLGLTSDIEIRNSSQENDGHPDLCLDVKTALVGRCYDGFYINSVFTDPKVTQAIKVRINASMFCSTFWAVFNIVLY